MLQNFMQDGSIHLMLLGGYFKCRIFSFEKEGRSVQQVGFDLIFLFRTGSFFSDGCVWVVSVPNDA